MQTLSQFFLTFLLNAVWQIGLIVLVAALCARLLRGASARYGYLLWVATLSLSLLLPILTSTGLWPGDLFNVKAPPVTAPRPDVGRLDTPLAEPSFAAVDGERATTLTIPIGMNLAMVILAAYLLFVLYRTAKFAAAWLRTRAIAHGVYRAPLPENIRSAIARCMATLGVAKAEVLCSDAVPVPVTIGDRRPLVILPGHMLDETDPDVLMTAVGHELVHVQRHDYAFNLLFEIICLPLSFHPAAVYAKRRIAHMRELCCDEIVAARLLNAEAYARSLLNIVGSSVALNRLSPTITVGITDAENLEVRIMSLLKRSELSVYKKSFLVAAAILLLAIPLVVAAFISPGVGVNTAAAQPDVQATPPLKEEEEIRFTERHQQLERKLMEVRKALEDPNLPEEKRAAYSQLERKIESEMDQGKLNGTDGSVGEIEGKRLKLEKQLAELEYNSGPADSREIAARRQELELELKKLSINDEDGNEEGRLKEKREQEEIMVKMKLAKTANISMEQAIEIAFASLPGTPVEKEIGSRLIQKDIGRINDEVVYKILIRDGEETPDGNASLVLVSGMDGRIIRTERTFIKTKRTGNE